MVIAAGTLAGCSSKPSGTAQSLAGEASGGTRSGELISVDGRGQIYYLNFKPEVADAWVELAEEYTAEAEVPMKIQAAAARIYEQVLKSEVAKKESPTLFQANGPIGYKSWARYCRDLSNMETYGHLMDKTMTATDGDGVHGVPYVAEGYGIIYNGAIMRKYFVLDGAKAASMDEINDFDTLEIVSEDMQVRKTDLGTDGVFASTFFVPGEDWRWWTHLTNLPIRYEYRDDGVNDKDAIDFRYSDNFRNTFDLYLNNSCTDPKMAGAETAEDSMAELVLGKVVMIQDGSQGWSWVAGAKGNTVRGEDAKFLPIYIGTAGGEKQRLCTDIENFFAINSRVEAEDQQASLDFSTWLFSSETSKDHITNRLGFIAPLDTSIASEKPPDPLAKEVDRYMSNGNLYSMSWNFTSFPNQTFKDDSDTSLLRYARGGKE